MVKKMSIGKKRIEWIDVAKYICIMFVMMSHLDFKREETFVFYAPFALEVFFFGAGYVYRHKKGFAVFLEKKIKTLLVPWLFFSVFNILLSHLVSFETHNPLLEELKWNFLQIRGQGDGVWFVAALFVFFIPFYFLIDIYEKSNKGNKERKVFVICALFLYLASHIYNNYMNPDLLPWGTVELPWHLEMVFIAEFWMVLGYLFRQEYEIKYDRDINVRYKILSVAAYLLLVFLSLVTHFHMYNTFTSIIYALVSSLLGVLTCIFISKNIHPNKYILYIGQNTLLCFALHGKVYSVLQAVIRKIDYGFYQAALNSVFLSFLVSVIISLLVSFILIIPIYIINRWLPILVGRSYPKKQK